MKRILPFLITCGLVAILMVATIFAPQTYAAEQMTGFSIAPAELSFNVRAESPSQQATLTLTNSYNTALHLTAELQSIDELGARLVPSGPADEQLNHAVKLSATDITVPAKGNIQLQVAVDGTWLTDGGHYASLVLSERSASTGQSGFRSAIAVSLFIIKNEHIRTDLRLAGLSFDRPLLSLPKSVSLTLSNHGNTHIIPRASVVVYDGQDIVSKAVINTESALLLPDRQANFTAKFDTYKRFWLPRRLVVRTMYRIDGSDIQLVKEQSIWHIPFVDSIGLVALAIAAWRWRRQLRRICANLVKRIKRATRTKAHKKPPKHNSAASPTNSAAGLSTTVHTHQPVASVEKSPEPTSQPSLQEALSTAVSRPKPTAAVHHITIQVKEGASTPPQPLTSHVKPSIKKAKKNTKTVAAKNTKARATKAAKTGTKTAKKPTTRAPKKKAQ
jgi:hypothetical protein